MWYPGVYDSGVRLRAERPGRAACRATAPLIFDIRRLGDRIEVPRAASPSPAAAAKLHIDPLGVARHVDQVVARIQAQEFRVTRPPEAAICRESDLRMLCGAEGTL